MWRYGYRTRPYDIYIYIFEVGRKDAFNVLKCDYDGCISFIEELSPT